MKKIITQALEQFRPPEVMRSWLTKASDYLRSFCSRQRPIPKEEKISLLVLIIVVGFFSAVVYHYAMGYYLGKPWPANSFLHTPSARFFDFNLVVRQSATLNPFEGANEIGGFAGTPFAQFVGYLFSVLQPVSLRLPIYFGSFFVVFILMVKHYLYGLKSKLASNQLLAIFVIVFLTYPVLFALDRANFDLLVVPCLFLFALTYGGQRYKDSTVFLGIAIALKPFAAIFILVYIFDRKYRDTLLVLFNMLFLSVLSLALFEGGLFSEIHKYFNSLWHVAVDPTFGSGLNYTSDLFSFLTVIARPIGDVLNSETLMNLTDHSSIKLAYAIIAVVTTAYFVIHLWQKTQPLWKTMAVLTILIILFPFTTHDYRLIYLFIPMLIYLGTSETTRNDLLIVVLWGLLLVPKDYYHFGSEQNITMLFNPLLLIGLLICIIPDAFSIRGIASALRFVYGKLQSIYPISKLDNSG